MPFLHALPLISSPEHERIRLGSDRISRLHAVARRRFLFLRVRGLCVGFQYQHDELWKLEGLKEAREDEEGNGKIIASSRVPVGKKRKGTRVMKKKKSPTTPDPFRHVIPQFTNPAVIRSVSL